jgi:hypothetical protein
MCDKERKMAQIGQVELYAPNNADTCRQKVKLHQQGRKREKAHSGMEGDYCH